jgi:hypothetical protein
MIEKWDKAISGHPGTPSTKIYKNKTVAEIIKDILIQVLNETGDK